MSPDDQSEPFLGGTKDRKPKLLHMPYQGTHRWLRVGTSITSSSSFSHFLVFFVTSLAWGAAFLVMGIYPLVASSRSAAVASTTAAAPAAALPFAEGTVIVKGAKLVTCGNTTEEAKRRGCTYDILSNHWVPAVCMDQDAVDEYMTDGTWFGYGDESRTQLLTIDAMSEMDYYYTNERDHIVHCAMLWRKQFRAFFLQRQNLDTIISDEEHTMHCSQFLMDMSDKGPDYRNMPIKTWVGQAGCWLRG
ncbi:hypothetical protein QBC47DRAFT_413171 [Echria macrotheca]|uniref:Uncharacterized protein n=1 Tax=Echria macrotheca TaxID=438768 RepID=A0AAJ0BBV7_9PEZI|nr:hypothetical protein QBC47DRAFT_413171 [Echria macrotheca]